MKHCGSCDTQKSFDEFYKDKTKKDGLTSTCKACQDLRSKTWEQNNREQKRLTDQNWHFKNRERIAKKSRLWQQNNPEQISAHSAKRKASQLKRTPPWLTKDHLEEIEQFYIDAQECRWLSNEPLEVDHIIPLQGKYMSGLHVPWNLRITTLSFNRSRRKHISPFIGYEPND